MESWRRRAGSQRIFPIFIQDQPFGALGRNSDYSLLSFITEVSSASFLVCLKFASLRSNGIKISKGRNAPAGGRMGKFSAAVAHRPSAACFVRLRNEASEG